MSQKQFLILIGAGIFCALLFAAPGLYRAFKEYEVHKSGQTSNASATKTLPPPVVPANHPEEAPSIEKYKELKLEQVRERASRGDAMAQYELGRRFDGGAGVDEDDIEAMKWYLSSAKLGVPEAQLQVGAAYDLGWLKSKEGKQEALKWYQLAANQGLVEAQVHTANLYLDGDGIQKNEEEAEKWFRLAAESGDAESAFKIAEITAAKAKADKSTTGLDEVIKWTRKAAELGHGEAQLQMGYAALRHDVPNVPHDLGAAANWWKKAAENGNTNAKNFISENFHRSQPSGPYMDQEKVMLYIKATELDDMDAAWRLGRAYADGSSPFKQSNSEAVKWLSKAAEKGHVVAQCNLADTYLHGEGVEKNPAMAFELFQTAANRGHNYAQIRMAGLYEDGVGCETDLTEALKWATIASLAEEDQKSASTIMWMRSGLPKLKNRMTSDQITIAETLAREWHSKHMPKN
jgi:TPR repeat protein